MRPRDIARLVAIGRPPAPHGARSLARCYSVDDVARVARRRLPRAAGSYLDGGGEDEHTLARNRAAFDDIELVPRILRDVHNIDLSTTLFGRRLPAPLLLAPVGGPRLLHHQAEPAVAHAASRAGVPYVVSTLASTSLEDIAAVAAGPLWFDLYVWGDRSIAKDLIARAAAAGYEALVVTADVTVRSKRERELRAGLTLPTPHLKLATALDAARHPRWWFRFLTSDAPTFPNLPEGTARDGSIDHLFDGTVTWADLEWIREAWTGPVVLKGVLHPDDARQASAVGIDGIVVSNHGGRQLDHVPATIDLLPRVVDAAGDDMSVLLDSGIRRGTDILTALARGADAVLVGRGYLYGLAAAGEAGVAHVLDILTDELRRACALTGLDAVANAHGDLLTKPG